MQKTDVSFCITSICIIGFSVLYGCSTNEDVEGIDFGAPTWAAFKEASTKIVNGKEIYVVEWDVPVSSLDELREYYDYYWGTSDRYQTKTSPLLVNQYDGEDDMWDEDDSKHLTYCVSTDFGTDYDRAVSEMNTAASDWSNTFDLRLIYDSSHDENCSNANTDITFSVRPWSLGGACSFFPSGNACISRTLVMDFNDFDTNDFWEENTPNVTTTGVFRHEIGHILGFRHEHIRPEAGGVCNTEDTDWRELTSYDQLSLMHYNWCGGVLESDLSFTALDIRGGNLLYGLSTTLIASSIM